MHHAPLYYSLHVEVCYEPLRSTHAPHERPVLYELRYSAACVTWSRKGDVKEDPGATKPPDVRHLNRAMHD